MKVLIVGPNQNAQGGVASYYASVYPKISDDIVEAKYLEIGSSFSNKHFTHPINDQVNFWKTIKQLNPDIIHINPSLGIKSFIRDGLFIFLAKLCNKKILVFFRGWDKKFENTLSKKLLWFFKITYGRADGFIVLAKSFSEILRTWEIKKPIFLGNTAVADELIDEFSIDQKLIHLKKTKTLKVLYLARLEKQKGILELIDSINLLVKQDLAIVLTIAGDGPILNEVIQKVEKLNLQKTINIVGYVRGKEKIDVFNTHDIYCLPTQYGEGMPNSILEAMAFGMGIVTCPVGGIVDFFDTNKMGTLLNTIDPNEIAKAISSMISNRDKLFEISAFNHSYAQKHFLASSAAEFLRSCYIQI